ncbi:helix-turn-helix domain-containing protein [Chitinilyticum aquatile]|uniref:helix-turn-helix domain-containing protein n=1 Tax=Chitinilyticum aquatile TaxID=362520 RepID=UPI000684D2DA|nr:helix-turn-helix transcriptional regulator [Chitinilyticum aquatile]
MSSIAGLAHRELHAEDVLAITLSAIILCINSHKTHFNMKKQVRMSAVDASTQTYLTQVGDRLKVLRILRKDTIAQMAERLQCSAATYTALEKGAPTTQIGLLAKALAIHGALDSLSGVAPVPIEALTQTNTLPKRVRSSNGTIPRKDELDF